MRKNVYDQNGFYRGFRDNEGNEYDENGYYMGRIDSNGNMYDVCGYFKGRITSKGKMYDNHGYYMGCRDEGGKLYDKYGHFIGTERDEDKNSCFLTTACIETKGLSDDCFELKTLHRFRDEYLVTISEGRKAIKYHYQISPKVINIINSQPNSKEIYAHLYEKLVMHCTALIVEGKKRESLEHYKFMVKSLEKKYLINQ